MHQERDGGRSLERQRERDRGRERDRESGRQNNQDLVGFPGGAVVKNPPANAGDTGSSPGLGRSHMPRSN